MPELDETNGTSQASATSPKRPKPAGQPTSPKRPKPARQPTSPKRPKPAGQREAAEATEADRLSMGGKGRQGEQEDPLHLLTAARWANKRVNKIVPMVTAIAGVAAAAAAVASPAAGPALTTVVGVVTGNFAQAMIGGARLFAAIRSYSSDDSGASDGMA
jgi:hypothetical protein